MRHFLLILLFGLLILRTLFLPTFPQTHDGQNHLARLANMAMAARDRHFPFRWAANLNYRFGHPIFNFNYHLPQVAGLVPVFLGFDIEASLKIVIIVSHIAAAIFWYLFLRTFLPSFPSFIAGLFSLSALYPLEIIFVRGSPGETMTFALIPLTLLLYRYFFLKPTRLWFLLSTLSFCLFFLSHNISVLFGTPLILAYIFLEFKTSKNSKSLLLPTIASIVLAVGLSLFFWLPVLLEKQFTHLQGYNTKEFIDHFPSLWQLFYSKWGYGFSRLGTSADGLGFTIGPALLLAALSTVLLKLPPKLRALSRFFKLTFAAYFLLMLPQFLFLWQLIPVFAYIQFPWRFLLFTSATAIPLAGLFAHRHPRLAVVLLSISIAWALTVAKPQSGFQWPDDFHYHFPFYTTSGDEVLPIWFDGGVNKDFYESNDYLRLPTSTSASLSNLTINYWKTHQHLYSFSTTQPTMVFERTAYFPGWEVAVDGRPVDIVYQDPVFPGIIGYKVDSGNHTVLTTFTDHTPARTAGNYLSLASLAILLLMVKYLSL